ncbi:hypothetical protein HBI12_054330 [Parastagonospora nodorum]|nr:hypothetical protein HBI12_054330 [Parastagonospora nodorum]KAH5433596.1 hypothetical protein HBI47_087270 [Parastagonospora nodorum]
MRPSFVLCLRKRVVDSLPSVTLVSEVKTLAGLSQEDYKKLPGMITRICNGMSYAEYRHQSIDFQESVVDQINAELKDAGVGTISHEIGRWLVLRNARSRHEYVKEKKLSDDWMNKFTGEHSLDAKTGWGLLLSSIYQVLEDYIEKNQIDGYHLYFSDIPEQEREHLADQIRISCASRNFQMLTMSFS